MINFQSASRPLTRSELRDVGMRRAVRALGGLCLAAAMVGCGSYAAGARDLVQDKSMVAVPVGGVGHYGSMMGIPDFYINNEAMGSVPGWGGGGASRCCVLLPRHITKPLIINVKWRTCDIGHIEFVNDRAVDPNARCRSQEHEATVPINFAVPPGKSSGLYLHFLPGHRVEAWVSRVGPANPEYPGPKFPTNPAPRYAPLLGEKPQPTISNKPSQGDDK